MDISPPTTDAERTSGPVREPFWSYIDLLIVAGLSFAAVVLIMMVVGVMVAAFPSIRKNPAPLLLPLQMVLYGLIYLAFRATFQLRYGKPVLRSLGWRPAIFNPLVMVGGGIALAFLVAALASFLHTPQVPSPFEAMMGSTLSLIFLGIFAVVIGPFSEELVFRGFLQPLFSRTFGMGAGILVTAVIFGLLHGREYSWAWQYVVAISLAGFVFGLIRARTNSVVPSTLMHGCYNLVFFIALIVSKYAKH